MTGATVHIVTLMITGGAVAFGVGATLWAYRLTAGVRAAQAIWRRRLTEAEDRLARGDAVFGAFPGLVLVWDPAPEETADGAISGWGAPRIFGSPSALASLLKFAAASEGPDPAGLLLEGVADYEARAAGGEETTLRRRFAELAAEGRSFSLTIIGPDGRFLEADGRAAGTQIVVWLSDTTIRGIEESGARGRLEEARRIVEPDPVAFLDMLDRAPFPAWRMNSTGRLIWANAAYVAAVEAKSLDDALSRQAALDGEMKTQAAEAARTGEPVSAVRAVIIGGKRRALSLVAFPVSGGAAGFAADITDGEEAKAALKRFRRAHDETLNHMAEAVAVLDRSKRLAFRNTAFETMFKLDPGWLDERPSHGELLDRLREKRLLPEQADYGGWKKTELARHEAPPGEETPDELWPLPDGRTLRVARQRHPLGGLMVIFEDKTDELALRARYNTLINVQRATLDRLHEAVAVFGSDGRLKLHNAAFETLWELQEADLEGQPEFAAVAEKCRALYADERVWSDIRARVTDPGPQARIPVVGDMLRSDDKTLTYLTRPLPDGATLIAWDDVTASKRIAAALQERAEALEESERIKSEFVEHVSYQLRTPLTTIGGYADMMAQGFAGELSERQAEYLGSIQAAAGDLAKLIDDILDVAAIDAGQLELDLGDVDLKALAEDSIALVAARAEHAGVKLTSAVAVDAGMIRADPKRLRQVTMNLLSNALRHSKAGGSVQLTLKRAGGAVSLSVADEGEGIALERQAKVFERFQRGARGGAGLGLALVKEIVELHGGWVELASESGKGTVVTCHLPEESIGDAAPPELKLKSDRRRAPA